MMTFYTATGSYRMQKEYDRKVPYIQKLGKLHPISAFEFVIWSTLLWEIMTYDEAKTAYLEQTADLQMPVPDFDILLKNLLARKLVTKGIGYTGRDALYNMLSNAFVVPCELHRPKRLLTAVHLWLKGRIGLKDIITKVMASGRLTEPERQVMDLVDQTPLCMSEIVRCFDRGVTDVSTPDRLLDAIYTDEDTDQDRIARESLFSANVDIVLEAVANLYLARKIIIERA